MLQYKIISKDLGIKKNIFLESHAMQNCSNQETRKQTRHKSYRATEVKRVMPIDHSLPRN